MKTSGISIDSAVVRDHIRLGWRRLVRLWSRAGDLDRTGQKEETAFAGEVGVSEIHTTSIGSGPVVTSDQLQKRLAALGLEEKEIERISPLLLAELKRTCARCDDKGRCADDFAEHPDPVGWDSYCPNSGTLKILS